MSEMQTPLIDLLRGVPINATATEHYDYESHHIPYGRLCHEAADEINRLRAENATLREELNRATSMPYANEASRAIAYGKQIDTLRKLVREAYEEADLGWLGTNWDERAEKALSSTPDPAPR